MKQSKWQAWLPAIFFAVAIHVLIIAVFLFSKDGDYTVDTNAGALGSYSDAQINHKTAGSELLFIESANSGTNSGADSYNLDTYNNTNDKTTLTNHEIKNFDSSSSQNSAEMLMTNSIITIKSPEHDNVINNGIQKEQQQNQYDSRQLTDSETLALDNANIRANDLKYNQSNSDNSSSMNESLTINNSAISNQSTSRFNSHSSSKPSNTSTNTSTTPSAAQELLTVRDVPKQQLSEIFVATDNRNPNLAETEIINEKLSSVISEVRQRNEQKIKQQQDQAIQAQQSITQSQQLDSIQEVTKQLDIEEAAQAEFSQLSTPKDSSEPNGEAVDSTPSNE